MPYDPSYAGAIASVESGGEKDPYGSLGPATRSGDQAYGKYQIMGANVGPWSKEILGQEMSPQDFLANPQAQDAVFQGKFGQYVDKYGPEGAAKAWFAGEKGMNNPNAKDVLGTTVAGYGQKFMGALGQPQGAPPALPPPVNIPSMQVADSQPAPGAFNQIGGSTPAPTMPAYGWSPQSQQQAAPDQQQAPSLNPMQMPTMQRHPVDLSKLKAMMPQIALRGFYQRG